MSYPTTPYASSTLYCEWQGLYGGFMNVSFHFNLGCDLFEGSGSDAGKWRLDSSVTDWSAYWDWGSSVGGGFINVGGICWADFPLTPSTIDLADGGDDTYALCVQQRNAVFGSEANFDSANIWGLYAEDMHKPPNVSGEWGGSTTHSQVITGDPFATDITIIAPYTRWYDWDRTDPKAIMGAGGTFSVSFSKVFADYYPGARMISNAWHSSNQPEGLWRMESGMWQPVKNREGDPSAASGFRRRSGSWVPEAKF